jgi:hypothetical protein
LPIDPVNNVSHYYTYVTGGSWALSALLESERRLREQANKDGGFNPGKFEVGTNLRLIALSEGLVGWWPFEEGSGTTTRDASGTGNTGTLHHGPTWQPPANCRQGGCLSFDGVDDRVHILDSASLDTAFGTLVWTKEAWAFPRAWVSWSTIIDKMVSPCWSHSSGGIWAFDAGFAATLGSGEPGLCNPSGGYNMVSFRPPLNVWHHVVVVADGARLHLYVNAVHKGSVVITAHTRATVRPNDAPVIIGRRTVADGPNFNGSIDEVRTYNRVLSAPEIAAIYAATK